MNKYQEALLYLQKVAQTYADYHFQERAEEVEGVNQKYIAIMQELVDRHEKLVKYLKENSVHMSNGHYTVRDEVWISDELMEGEK